MKIVSLVGARPQFVKEAIVYEAVEQAGAWEHVLVHSGQHYDAAMSDIFFEELKIPQPKYHMGIGSGSHGAMTAAALRGMEDVLGKEKPDALLVYGDTNTTLAGALAASKMHIPVIHVEAGIRQEPKNMPEEINRVLTDHVSKILCCCSELGRQNLLRENISNGVFVNGDVMYDLFVRMRAKFDSIAACRKYGVQENKFYISTLHRDFNVDNPQSLQGILAGLNKLADETGLPIILPMHPRTRKNMQGLGFIPSCALKIVEPIGYIELMSLVCASAAVITDSGGLQKEAYYAGKRAVVVMPDTGWREITDCGWNLLCATDEASVLKAGQMVLDAMQYPAAIYGNGQAGLEIVGSVCNTL